MLILIKNLKNKKAGAARETSELTSYLWEIECGIYKEFCTISLLFCKSKTILKFKK